MYERYPNAREALGDDAVLLWDWAAHLFLGRDPGLDLSKAAQQIYLTASTSNRRKLVQLVANCFAPVRALFRDDLSDRVTEMLRPLANDPLIVRAVCDALARHQVTNDVMNNIGESLKIDLAATLALADRLVPRST